MATDYDCWKEGEKVSVNYVLESFEKNVTKVMSLITSAIPAIASENWDDTINELHVSRQNMPRMLGYVYGVVLGNY